MARFETARATAEALVLATVIATTGATYRKAGAQMLVARDGTFEGLLSGGCLEPDLAQRAAEVFETGRPILVRYDNAGEDDALWGLGSGCEGAMEIWLTRLGPVEAWQPLATLAASLAKREAVDWCAVIESDIAALPAGTFVCGASDLANCRERVPPSVGRWLVEQFVAVREGADARIAECAGPRLRAFIGRLGLPREVLILGAGLDAQPVVDFGAALGWNITVADHRVAYADAGRFPRASGVVLSRPADLPKVLDPDRFDAAVVMSHHLEIDRGWLELLAAARVPYVGLLGPESRRTHLLAQIGAAAGRLRRRLHAPVGLDLGGRDPQSIALAIVAEIQAHFHGRVARDLAWTRR